MLNTNSVDSPNLDLLLVIELNKGFETLYKVRHTIAN